MTEVRSQELVRRAEVSRCQQRRMPLGLNSLRHPPLPHPPTNSSRLDRFHLFPDASQQERKRERRKALKGQAGASKKLSAPTRDCSEPKDIATLKWQVYSQPPPLLVENRVFRARFMLELKGLSFSFVCLLACLAWSSSICSCLLIFPQQLVKCQVFSKCWRDIWWMDEQHALLSLFIRPPLHASPPWESHHDSSVCFPGWSKPPAAYPWHPVQNCCPAPAPLDCDLLLSFFFVSSRCQKNMSLLTH